MGLYVHIPFCRSKCAYCDFYSVPRPEYAAAYVDAVCAEYGLRAGEIGLDLREPSTIYLGGGTPSLLDEEIISKLMQRLPSPALGAEVTIEANPDDVTPTKADAWLHAGINRVSMGVQSFDDKMLSAIGRRHDAKRAVEAYNELRMAGLDNISLDLIYGLPGQSFDDWMQSVDRLMVLRPEHFSAYLLSYEPGTRLYAKLITGKIQETDEEILNEMYAGLCRAAAANGYEHYEISNFALPGFRARHNASYWQFRPYLGLGPGAHSFDGRVRRYNPSNLKHYLEMLERGECACIVDEETDTDRLNDRIMVGLRTSDGLTLSSLGDTNARKVLSQAGRLPRGSVLLRGGSIRIPEDKWLVSDGIIAALLLEE